MLLLDMPPPTPIARFLAHRREELGLTLEQVGELIGKSKQSVWQRESGAAKVKHRPRVQIPEVALFSVAILWRFQTGDGAASLRPVTPAMNRSSVT